MNSLWNLNLQVIGTSIINYGYKIIIALLVLFIGFKAIKIIMKVFKKFLGKTDIDESLYKYLVNISEIGLKILLTFGILETTELIKIAPFLTVIGAAGLAVGLAFQGSLSNFAGGVLILTFRPFKVGDFIEAQGYAGIVDEISIIYTVLNTVDNKRVIVPNGDLSNSSCINYSANDKRRVDITFGVGYDADINKVKEVIGQIANKHEFIFKDPAPFIRVVEHGDSSVNFVTRVWCKTEHYWDVYFDLMEEVKVAFDKEGINIPYPHMDVTMLKS
ncbi:mechanosensitive ion channel [Clostridium sediminicola]|uniref:mechanosensitive ion channel family protein n=1 Tax=Clostridium sediminicola TaxID=3114879 RepID=UPI0031F1D5A6